MVKKTKIRSSKSVDEQYLGSEPEFDLALQDNDVRLARAFGWYNYFHTVDDSRKWIVEYMKNTKYPLNKIEKFKRADNSTLSMTVVSLARIANRGYKLPVRSEQFLKTKIESAIQTVAIVEQKTDKPIKLNIQQKIRQIADNVIAEFDEQIDIFVTDGSNDFQPSEYYSKNQIKAGNLHRVVERYARLVEEIDLALSGNDQELFKSFRMTKAKMNKYREFVSRLVEQSSFAVKVSKAKSKVARKKKTRTKKVKSASDLTKKIDVLLEIKGNTSIVGLTPDKVVGAKQVWVYTPKDRLLGVYNASDDAQTLTVKGVSVVGYDPKTSFRKKLRKPDPILQSVTTGGKVTLRKLMDTINAKQQLLRSRLNSDTVILRVIK